MSTEFTKRHWSTRYSGARFAVVIVHGVSSKSKFVSKQQKNEMKQQLSIRLVGSGLLFHVSRFEVYLQFLPFPGLLLLIPRD